MMKMTGKAPRRPRFFPKTCGWIRPFIQLFSTEQIPYFIRFSDVFHRIHTPYYDYDIILYIL